MKKIFLFLCFPAFCIAQNINGIVTSNAKNIPLEDVNIFIPKKKTGTLTNQKGEFTLKLPANIKENDSIEFSHIGFSPKTISYDELKKANFRVELLENTENLSGLTITASQKNTLKKKLDFKKLSPLKYPLSSFGSVLIADKIYIIGGDASFEADAFKKIRHEKPDFTMEEYLKELQFQNNMQLYRNNLLIYDIKADTWEVSDLKFKKRAYHNLNYYNNKIYIISGKRSSVNGKFEYLEDQIEVFDTKKQTISIDKTNPHQAANSTSFTYKDNIIVMGGSVKMNSDTNKKVFTNKVHQYNISSGYWYELPNMTSPKESAGILIDNKIFLIGGNNGKPLSEIETFDLSTEKWNTEGKLFSEIDKPAITFSGNTIYFFEDRKIYLYNINSKELKEYTVELGLKDSAMYYTNDNLYILGGRIESEYSKFPSSNVYSISIDEFETTEPNRIKTL